MIFAMCDRLLLLASVRPQAHVLPCPEGALETVYAQLLEAIGRAEQ